jgi:hypothetical protein
MSGIGIDERVIAANHDRGAEGTEQTRDDLLVLAAAARLLADRADESLLAAITEASGVTVSDPARLMVAVATGEGLASSEDAIAASLRETAEGYRTGQYS